MALGQPAAADPACDGGSAGEKTADDGNGAQVFDGPADGLAADSGGDIYFTTGNGTFDANTGGGD